MLDKGYYILLEFLIFFLDYYYVYTSTSAFLCFYQILCNLDPNGDNRASTASSTSQWILPDLHRELQIAMDITGLYRDFQIAMATAGPQPRAPDSSGHYRTSTASCRSQWALPDLNREL